MDRKALVLTAAFCLVPTLALSDGRDNLMRALSNCAQLTIASSRLACYDRLAPEFDRYLKTPVASAPPPPPSKEEKESWFGLDNLFGGGEEKPQATPQEFGEERLVKTPQEISKAKEEEIDSISAHLTDYATNSFGKFTVFLDNGQIWQQLDADSGKAQFDRDPHRVKVKVERAIFGTYSMTISGNTKLFKVKRVR
ncbi:MAG TPA: hypothetical protein VMS78_05120 [Rhizomicrobium sp.]|nr:hypothetical protein [Rhizomicrobium sp.]